MHMRQTMDKGIIWWNWRRIHRNEWPNVQLTWIKFLSCNMMYRNEANHQTKHQECHNSCKILYVSVVCGGIFVWFYCGLWQFSLFLIHLQHAIRTQRIRLPFEMNDMLAHLIAKNEHLSYPWHNLYNVEIVLYYIKLYYFGTCTLNLKLQFVPSLGKKHHLYDESIRS